MSKYSLIIIIDDSEIDTFLNKVILETLHFANEIISFTNPGAALNYFQMLGQNPDLKKIPDVIFLDINMPIMNGFQFLEEFDKLPSVITSKTKFYLISSSEDPEDLEKTSNYQNIIKCLNKPLDKKELL